MAPGKQKKPTITWKVPPANPTGVRVVKRRKVRRQKPKAVLKSGETISAKKLALHPYDVEPAISKYFATHLVPGMMFVVANWIEPWDSSRWGIQPHKYPYVVLASYNMTGFKPGTIAMYMGPTRVDEQIKRKIVSVKRHTFLIDSQMILSKDVERHFIPVKVST